MMDIGRKIKQIAIGTTSALGISYLSLLGLNNLMYNSGEYKNLGSRKSESSVTRADGIFFSRTTLTRTYEQGVATKDKVRIDGLQSPLFLRRVFRSLGQQDTQVVDGGQGMSGTQFKYDGLVDYYYIESFWHIELISDLKQIVLRESYSDRVNAEHEMKRASLKWERREERGEEEGFPLNLVDWGYFRGYPWVRKLLSANGGFEAVGERKAGDNYPPFPGMDNLLLETKSRLEDLLPQK